MKIKLPILLSSLLLASCGSQNSELGFPSSNQSLDPASGSTSAAPTILPTEASEGDETLVLDLTLVYGHIQKEDGTNIAPLLYNHSYYSFKGTGSVDKPEKALVAGDQVYITFDGAYEGICLMTYPSQCTIEGDIISTRYEYAEVQKEEVASVDGLLSVYLHASYGFARDFIILDPSGAYIPLDEYRGDEVYVTSDLNAMSKITCPEGAYCEPSLYPIAGIYAYDPRNPNS